MAPINPIRGEVKVAVGDVELVLAATMESLARLSTELACPSFQDLYRRLIGVAPDAVRAALVILTQSGSRGAKQLNARTAAEAAIAMLAMDDLASLSDAFGALFLALRRDRREEPAEKNGDSAQT